MGDSSRVVKLVYPIKFSKLGRPDKIPIAVYPVTAARDHQACGKIIVHSLGLPPEPKSSISSSFENVKTEDENISNTE